MPKPTPQHHGGGNASSQNLGKGHTKADVELMQERNLVARVTGESSFQEADQFYFTQFTALNGSGVAGQAIVGYDDESNTLTVAISARGLEPNQPHIQHIHGFVDGTDAQTPTIRNDTDGDGYVELAEGLPEYGEILLNLSTNHTNGGGADNGHSHDGGVTGFPTAPDGNVWFIETYVLPQEKLGAEPMLDLREIVLHGLTVPGGVGAGTTGEVDGTAGYKLVLPVASGELSAVTSIKDLRAFIHDTGFDDAAHRANHYSSHDGWAIG